MRGFFLSAIVLFNVQQAMGGGSVCLDAFVKFSTYEVPRPTRYHHYVKDDGYTINPHYKYHVDFLNFSMDQDHNFKVTSSSQLEAITALSAIEQKLLTAPVVRGPPGCDFVDGLGQFWDIKTPVSPHFSDTWQFRVSKAGESILNQLIKDPDIMVLLDISYLSHQDFLALYRWMKKNISSKLKQRIKVITVMNGLVPESSIPEMLNKAS